MIRKLNSVLPVGILVALLGLSIPMTSSGVINSRVDKQQPSEQLLQQMKKLEADKALCGEDRLCRIYGGKVKLNRENSLKFIALVNTLSGKR